MKQTLILFFAAFSLSLFNACQNAPKGEKAATSEAETVEAQEASTTLAIDSTSSVIQWTGSKVGGQHTGTLAISSGTVSLNDGKIVGGSVTIDMNSLTNTDMAAGEGKEDLEGHLKSADFFDVENNPTSTFEISEVGDSTITGNLTLMGVTKSITFPAQAMVKDMGVKLTTPDFTINRTDFGIKYGSASLADVVKDKAISDEVGLRIALAAR